MVCRCTGSVFRPQKGWAVASETRFCVLTRIGSDRAGGAGGFLLSVPGALREEDPLLPIADIRF